ncbi:hypothetical protein OH492_15705 [Vibrio chagasii]|nr:hypothetical protein [Vibrio chagasii]
MNAQHTNLILSISYLVLIPAIVSAVMVVSINTPAEEKNPASAGFLSHVTTLAKKGEGSLE